jgi:hypothetical protein
VTTTSTTAEKLQKDSFDMGQLEQVTASVDEPFPSIIWVSNDDPSSRGHIFQSHHSKFSKHQFFFMSPEARRLKRRRRGRGSGYLVRCLEVHSLLFFDDDGTDEADDQIELRPVDAFIPDGDFSHVNFESTLSNDLSRSSRSDNSNTSEHTRP